MARIPKKKKWPKGLKARLNRQKRIDERIAENKRIEKEIEAARKKVSR